MQYLDFDLTISGGPNTYDVAARSATAEARERASIVLAEDETALIAKLAGPGTRIAAKALGQRLFDEVFKGTVRDLYGRTQAAARQQRLRGVRVRLAVLAPELTRIPWSLLYDPGTGNHLSLQLDTPLIHTLPSLNPIEPITTPTPLKMLAMASSPTDMPSIDVAAEKKLLEAAIKKLADTQRISLTWIEPTWRSLQATLQTSEWHMFYFIGHGAFDTGNGEGYVALCDRNGDSEPTLASDIGGLLANHDTMRLVHLAACEGAASGDADIYASTAATILKRGVPAVLAMQRPVSTEAGAEITSVFYETLANSYPVDLAVIEARMAVRRYNSAEWATPALFLRAPDGRLFDPPATQSTPPASSQTSASTAPAQPAVPDPSSPHGQLLALAAQPAAGVPRPALRRAMAAAMALNDVKLLCDNLTQRIGQRVSVEDLGGETKEIIILNLIQFLDRRGLLQALLDELKSH